MVVEAVGQELKFYKNPVRRIFGNGCFSQLSVLVQSFGPKKILLVLGEKSFRSSPYYSRLREMLGGIPVIEAAPVSQNPQQAVIQEEINRLKKENYDLVIAVGGGSVLDVSKLLAGLPKQRQPNLDFYLNSSFQLHEEPVPVIAVPTTSGTGSEVTPYASLETNEKKKITISHMRFYPAAALIDPELTYTMPEYVTACTGFDALSQAIESFWAVQSTPFSQTHALRAIELIYPSLENAVSNPRDPHAREAMALGSCEAGLAIAYTKTTAVHSVSYPITAHFGVAHGHACALTLAPFMKFNAEVLKEKGKPMLQRLEADSYDSASKKIDHLMKKAGLESSLGKLGIDEKGRALIVKDGFRPDRVLNNPRKLEINDLEKILASIA